jgi:hypothetical protein
MTGGRLVLNDMVFLFAILMLTSPPKGKCPFRGGVVMLPNPKYIFEPPHGVSIDGKDSLVRSAVSGAVIVVIKVGDAKGVMTKVGHLYYTYAGLDSCVVTKGQSIHAGQTIGFSKAREIDFMISNRNMQFIGNTQAYVNCRCEIQTEAHHSGR